MNWDISQGPEIAWRLAGQLPRGTNPAESNAGQTEILVQDEPRIRIVMSSSADASTRLITKIYRTPLALTWRDLFRYPQAQREFENLRYAFGKELPVAKPVAFGLRRVPGRDWFSQLTIGFLDGLTLRDVLADEGRSKEEMAALLAGAGQLVASMHQAGMVWGTAHSGNFMVDSTTGSNPLHAFDFPYALCTNKDMTGTRLALYDVWNFAVDLRTQCKLEAALVDRFFQAYSGQTGADWKRLKQQVDTRKGRKAVFWQRLYIRTVRSFRIRPF